MPWPTVAQVMIPTTNEQNALTTYAITVVLTTLTPEQPRCLNVGAGGVDVPAGAGFAEQEVEDDPEDDGDPDAVIQTKRFSIVEHVFERLGRLGIELHDRVCVVVAVYELGNAARNGHCAKGRDKRREFEFCDKQTIEHADQQTAEQGSPAEPGSGS